MKRITLFLGLSFFLVNIFMVNLSAQQKGARWQFENNGVDSAAWDIIDNNGELSNQANYSNEHPLVEGEYYLSLEDSTQYGVFIVPDDSELDFSNESLAISAWIYPTLLKSEPQFILTKGNRSGTNKTNNYALRLDGEHLVFIVHNENGSKKAVASSFSIAKNQWSYIAVFFNNDEKLVYLWNNADQAPVDTLSFDIELFPNDQSLYIGTAGNNGFKRFRGRIDDVRIGSSIEQINDSSSEISLQENATTPVQSFKLNQNYPNPFNSQTVIEFELLTSGHVSLDVYNIPGQKILTLVDNEMAAGRYAFNFNAIGLSSGCYYYILQSADFRETKKMIVLK